MKTKIEYFKNIFLKEDNNFYVLDKDDDYVENFGKQWRDYRNVQIDSINNFEISRNYLNQMFFNNFNIFKNKSILEIGGGAGRFTEYFSKYSNKCVSVDLSSSVYYNVSIDKINTIIIKSDFNKLIADQKFDIVFCRGVLQHTVNPLDSILKIHSFVKEDGFVFFDIYKMPKVGYLHPKYFLWRPLIKLFFTYESFEKLLKNNIKIILKSKRFIKKIFLNSNFFSDCIIPIWDYKDKLDLNENDLEKWSVMDTLDGIFAKYDYPQRNKRIINFLKKNNIKIINNDKKNNIFQTQKI